MTSILNWRGEAQPINKSSINDDDLYLFSPDDDLIVDHIGCKDRRYMAARYAPVPAGMKRLLGMELKHLIKESA